jgi:adenylate kinase family enzyme
LILARAAVVFRPWTQSAQPLTRWTLEAGAAPQTWSARSNGANEILVRGDATRAVTTIESLSMLRLLDGPPDVLTLHAALASTPDGRGVLIVGPNGAGKSTLACALWRRWFSLLGDDIVVVDADTAEAASAPRRVSLRVSSRTLLDERLWGRIASAPASEATSEGYIFHPEEVDGRPRPAATRLAVCIFLKRSGVTEGDGTTRRIEPAQAVLALLPYSNLIRRQDAGIIISRLAPLAAAVPAYDLDRGPLDTMVDTVERLLDGGP